MRLELGIKDSNCFALQWYHDGKVCYSIMDNKIHDIYEFKKRDKKYSPFTVAMCIPTGIGANPGGHAGDAGPIVAAMPCDRIIVHPNVVNGSDLTALPSHALYVEGYNFTRLLRGTIALRPVLQNKIVLYTEKLEVVEHAAAAANYTCGFNVTVRKCETLNMVGGRYPHCPSHKFEVKGFDAIAITSHVFLTKEEQEEYYKGNILNPWGVVEAMLSHQVSADTGLPCAHAPMTCDKLDPPIGPMSAEAISYTWLHSVLHGLNKAPALVDEGIDAGDIDVLCIPLGCYGLQVQGAIKQGIPIIYIDDGNKMNCSEVGIIVKNWYECMGLVASMRAGVCIHEK